MKYVIITMPDESEFSVPLQVVLEKLAAKQAGEVLALEALEPVDYKEDFEAKRKALLATLQLSADSSQEMTKQIIEEAQKELDWYADVEIYAQKTLKAPKVCLSEGWRSGYKEVVEK